MSNFLLQKLVSSKWKLLIFRSQVFLFALEILETVFVWKLTWTGFRSIFKLSHFLLHLGFYRSWLLVYWRIWRQQYMTSSLIELVYNDPIFWCSKKAHSFSINFLEYKLWLLLKQINCNTNHNKIGRYFNWFI